MIKRLTAAVLSLAMILCGVMTTWATTGKYHYISDVSLTLTYEPFLSGTTNSDSDVTVTKNDNNPSYTISTAMDVPSNGWSEGDRPDLRITLEIDDPDQFRFNNNAASSSGINVDGGEVHYGELRSSGQKVYYEVYLDEVQANSEDSWTSRDWSSSSTTGNAGPSADGAQGAWLQDPTTKRYWFSISNGTRPINSWLKVSGSWYFFDATGFMVTNQWIQTNGKWYYVGNDGRMYKNRTTPDGYTVKNDGSWDGGAKK